jgi:aminoglycoside phosphotransferase (APT) family kinase protein
MLGWPIMSRPDPATPGSLTEVRTAHRFDEGVLHRYLKSHLDGYSGELSVQQFEGGQSNPTFLLTAGDARYVLRKKPPGKLLPSAHMVEREYRICRALRDTGVPVPKTHLLCEDASVMGTPFYVMDYIQGRVLRDDTCPGMEPAERRAVYSEMARVLAALHNVDVESHGLEDYGKPGNYFERQIGRWTKQYLAARTDEIPSMEGLIEWLPANVPSDDVRAVVHGDYQLYNLMFHSSEPRVLAVLDWELSTLGHPMADLAYSCMKYHYLPSDGMPPEIAYGGDTGIPDEDEFIGMYCAHSGRDRIDRWNFYLAFSFFRLASIIQGVYKRGLDGNASSDTAVAQKDRIASTADVGWRLAREMEQGNP